MDAGDSKTYQLMVIDSVLEKAEQDNTISTYIPLLTDEFKKLFCAETPRNTLCSLLQHEFSIQIKGRTDCTFENYLELPSIKNGLPCKNPEEKQLVFTLFNAYQTELNSMNNYDVDDVTLEALSRLNAPVWRRERKESGYDYILVDEMHLFSLNEQTVFHFLTKDATKKSYQFVSHLITVKQLVIGATLRETISQQLFLMQKKRDIILFSEILHKLPPSVQELLHLVH